MPKPQQQDAGQSQPACRSIGMLPALYIVSGPGCDGRRPATGRSTAGGHTLHARQGILAACAHPIVGV
eukprot:3017833-Pyramimonas_sp.AAC.1